MWDCFSWCCADCRYSIQVKESVDCCVAFDSVWCILQQWREEGWISGCRVLNKLIMLQHGIIYILRSIFCHSLRVQYRLGNCPLYRGFCNLVMKGSHSYCTGHKEAKFINNVVWRAASCKCIWCIFAPLIHQLEDNNFVISIRECTLGVKLWGIILVGSTDGS